MNPLDQPGIVFTLELLNPNPTFSKTKDGPVHRVSFEVSSETWDCFRAANTKGMMIVARAVVVSGDEDAAVLQESTEIKIGTTWSHEAEILWRSGFFMAPAVWRQIGRDADYLGWLRSQPCAFCKAKPAPESPTQAAHVRRVSEGSGMGIKPEYCAVPLCVEHHLLQHQKGEVELGGKEQFDKWRIRYVKQWAWETLKRELRYDHWYEIAPEVLDDWAEMKGLSHYLPKEYRDAANLRRDGFSRGEAPVF